MMSSEDFEKRLTDVLLRLPPGEKAQQRLASLIVVHTDSTNRACTTILDHRRRHKHVEAERQDFLLALEELADTQHAIPELPTPMPQYEPEVPELPDLLPPPSEN